MGTGKWLRVRFRADEDDFRPVVFPPPGPYWCSGYGNNHAIVVAYVGTVDQIAGFWPEASEIVVMEEGVDIAFSDRFPEPAWWGQVRASYECSGGS